MSAVLTGRSRLAGVVGYPVTHSLSPRLHGYWLHRYGIDGVYVPLPVHPGEIKAALEGLSALGFAGVNVTVPHKQAALENVDKASPEAKRVGAVNTIVIAPDGERRGSNTDVFGFIENLKASWRNWHASSGPAVVFGAGGAARAVCVALIDENVPEIRLVNRTRERAEAVAADLGGSISVVPWSSRRQALDGAALVVNTTTLGMDGNPPLPLDLAALPTGAVVTDIVYSPLETPLLADARARGNPVVDGLGMLLHQARPGFAAWFGVDPEVTEELRTFVVNGLKDR